VITIGDSIRPVKPTIRVRVIACVLITVAALVGSLFSTGEFLGNFGSFLVILLYILVPWTAVNLVDYYFVRRGNYAVREIFKADGIYGNWGWRGLASYVIGIIAMVPFVVTVWFTGPIAAALGGADLALFVGVIASAVAYLVLARNLDLDNERRVAAADKSQFGQAAVAFD